MWSGHVLRQIYDKYGHYEPIVVAITFIYWIACIQNNIYIELSCRHYPYFIFSFIEAISGTIVFDYLSKSFSVNKVGSSFQYIGRHTLAILCIHHLDLYWIIWGGWIKSWPLAAFTRLVVDLCILLIFIQIKDLIKKKKHTQDTISVN